VAVKDIAAMTRWAARDLLFNLEALPADRLDWRPAPEAKSALQMAGEVAGVFRNTLPVLQGGGWTPQPLPDPATLEEAREMVLASADAYANALEQVHRATLDRNIELPFGTFWAERFVLFPLIDAIHHRAQICYLQSLLGDAEVRFDPEASGRFLTRPS
jgi:uncharacterized damage-inducible protein DinB